MKLFSKEKSMKSLRKVRFATAKLLAPLFIKTFFDAHSQASQASGDGLYLPSKRQRNKCSASEADATRRTVRMQPVNFETEGETQS